MKINPKELNVTAVVGQYDIKNFWFL